MSVVAQGVSWEGGFRGGQSWEGRQHDEGRRAKLSTDSMGDVPRTDALWNKLACPREPTGSPHSINSIKVM